MSEQQEQRVYFLGGPRNGTYEYIPCGVPRWLVPAMQAPALPTEPPTESDEVVSVTHLVYDIDWSTRRAYFNYGEPEGYSSSVPARTNAVKLRRSISEAQTMRSHPRAAVAYDNLANDLQLSLNELELRRSAMQWQRFGEAAKPYNKQHVLLLARTTERPCFAVQYNEARRAWDLGGTSAPAHNDDRWLALDALLPSKV
jgi:hypothetical protein